MTDKIMTDFELTILANNYAKEIFDQVNDIEEGYNLAHQYADGCEWVIYTYKAHLLCLNCNTDDGQAFVNDCYAGTSMTYDEMGSAYAYGELHSRIMSALNTLFDN